MRVLVTGGAGFIGSNLALRLQNDGHDVTVIDDFSSGTFKNLIKFRGEVRTIDMGDPDEWQILEDLRPFEVVFHEASITDTTVLDQRKMMQNNAEAFRVLLDVAAEWESRVIWASSAATYGRGPAPMKESQPPEPLNVYGYSKLAMEDIARQWSPSLEHPIVGLRYFNVYGPGEQHKAKFASMIHQLAKQMRAGKRPRIFTPGDQRRDFVYIDDVIQINLKALNAKESGVFNVGAGSSASFNDIVHHLNRVLKTNLPAEYFENPYDFFQTWTEADLTQSRRVLGYEPQFDLGKGIDAYHASGTLGAD